jgi:hypothetical protein
MAELFQTTKQNVSPHIQNCFVDGELQRAATFKEYLTVQLEGTRSIQRRVEFYNLDFVILTAKPLFRAGEDRLRASAGEWRSAPREAAAPGCR